MVGYTVLRGNTTDILAQSDQPNGVYKNMRGCILEVILKDYLVIKRSVGGRGAGANRKLWS